MATDSQEWFSAAVELIGFRDAATSRPYTIEEVKAALDDSIRFNGLQGQASTEIKHGTVDYVTYEGPSELPLRHVETMGCVTVLSKHKPLEQRGPSPLFSGGFLQDVPDLQIVHACIMLNGSRPPAGVPYTIGDVQAKLNEGVGQLRGQVAEDLIQITPVEESHMVSYHGPAGPLKAVQGMGQIAEMRGARSLGARPKNLVAG